MPYTRPTLAAIIARIKSDLTAKLGNQISALSRAWSNIYATALGGAVHLLYGFIDWVYRQSFAVTAEREALINKASVYGLTIKPATFAEGFVHLLGVDGTVIPVGTIIKRADGMRYEVDVAAVMVSTATDVHVKCLVAGISGNLAAGTPVTLESPIAGINSSATVAQTPVPGDIRNGIDEEDVEVFRARYFERTRRPPQGGAAHDYKAWAKEVTGVGEAYAYGSRQISGGVGDLESPALPPIGEVWVYVETGDSDSPEVSPTTVTAVSDYLETKKSATATVQVFSVEPKTLNFSVQVGVKPGTSQSQITDEIVAELKDLLLRDGGPNGKIFLSKIDEAISNAASENNHILLSPEDDIVIGYNERATIGFVAVSII